MISPQNNASVVKYEIDKWIRHFLSGCPSLAQMMKLKGNAAICGL